MPWAGLQHCCMPDPVAAAPVLGPGEGYGLLEPRTRQWMCQHRAHTYLPCPLSSPLHPTPLTRPGTSSPTPTTVEPALPRTTAAWQASLDGTVSRANVKASPWRPRQLSCRDVTPGRLHRGTRPMHARTGGAGPALLAGVAGASVPPRRSPARHPPTSPGSPSPNMTLSRGIRQRKRL